MTTIRVRCPLCRETSDLREEAVTLDGPFYRFTCLCCSATNRRVLTSAIHEVLTDAGAQEQEEIEDEVAAFHAQLADPSVAERWLAK